MPRYTDRDRRKSIATRRRNARLRREQIAKLGYNPYNPTVKLTDNVVVTKEVEKRITKKAKSEIPIIGILVFIWVLTGVIISRFSEGQSGWQLLTFIIALALSVLVLVFRWAAVKSRTNELALERKERLDETRQFYSSPEWNLIRKQVIKAKGRVCSECGNPIANSYDVTVDHIRPRSKYPELALDKDNLRVLCRSCNSSKGDRDSEISAFE